MQLIRSLDAAGPWHGGFVSIGNFDGVHRGHQEMARKLVSRAASCGAPAIVVTFDPHPVQLLRPELAPPPLTTLTHRAELLGRHGVTGLLALPTDRALLELTADEFFERVIVGRLGARGLVEGPNFFFGRHRAGNITTLRAMCQAREMSLDVISPVTVGDQWVSSSVIRSLLQTGDTTDAVNLLGHPYRLSGIVGSGAQRGRTIGFPTANLIDTATLVPGPGVHAGLCEHRGSRYPAAIHIGPNPTFGEDQLKVEIHLLDFDGDLYGQELAVDFLSRIREVRKFASVGELTSQLHQDLAEVRVRVNEITGAR
jgi:riboflavin kinase / FMN adenylyltransferase